MAGANNYPNAEFMSLLGYAQIDAFNNNIKSACSNVKKAEAVYHKKMGQKLGPISRTIIDDLGCDFSFERIN